MRISKWKAAQRLAHGTQKLAAYSLKLNGRQIHLAARKKAHARTQQHGNKNAAVEANFIV